jgi:hypothetical protein
MGRIGRPEIAFNRPIRAARHRYSDIEAERDLEDGVVQHMMEAVIEAGGAETRYVRAGAGRPVVLLLRAVGERAHGSGVAADPLFARLAAEFRVIAPALPAGRVLTGWVRDVVDGLGLDRPALVVDAGIAAGMIPVAAAEDDRCRSFVVLHPTREGLPSPDDVVAYRGGAQGRIRLLELCVDGARALDAALTLDEVAVEALIEFLRQDPD